jgi:hypothetical protein
MSNLSAHPVEHASHPSPGAKEDTAWKKEFPGLESPSCTVCPHCAHDLRWQPFLICLTHLRINNLPVLNHHVWGVLSGDGNFSRQQALFREWNQASIVFVAPCVSGMVGARILGEGYHTVGETAFLDSLPKQANRNAVLMDGSSSNPRSDESAADLRLPTGWWPTQLRIDTNVFPRWVHADIQLRPQFRRQHSMLRRATNRTRFGFQGNLCSTTCTKSGHVNQSPQLLWSFR